MRKAPSGPDVTTATAHSAGSVGGSPVSGHGTFGWLRV